MDVLSSSSWCISLVHFLISWLSWRNNFRHDLLFHSITNICTSIRHTIIELPRSIIRQRTTGKRIALFLCSDTCPQRGIERNRDGLFSAFTDATTRAHVGFFSRYHFIQIDNIMRHVFTSSPISWTPNPGSIQLDLFALECQFLNLEEISICLILLIIVFIFVCVSRGKSNSMTQCQRNIGEVTESAFTAFFSLKSVPRSISASQLYQCILKSSVQPWFEICIPRSTIFSSMRVLVIGPTHESPHSSICFLEDLQLIFVNVHSVRSSIFGEAEKLYNTLTQDVLPTLLANADQLSIWIWIV